MEPGGLLKRLWNSRRATDYRQPMLCKGVLHVCPYNSLAVSLNLLKVTRTLPSRLSLGWPKDVRAFALVCP